MTDKIVVLCTCASVEEGERIARQLVEMRLAACVNLIPRMRSIYRWKGEVESSEECQLVIKSARGLFAALRVEVEKIHPYEVPELLAIPIVEGADMYMQWLAANLRADQESPS